MSFYVAHGNYGEKMSGFTKLVPEIVQSSIWNESSDIRIVWITMLAVKDETGYVQGDSRTLSRIANVPQDRVIEALELFQKPDPFSHTPDDDGRRIAPAAGGWVVLNHEKYRIRDHRAEHAEYVRKWRKNRTVKKCDSQGCHGSASASVSASESLEEGAGETISIPANAKYADLFRQQVELLTGSPAMTYEEWAVAHHNAGVEPDAIHQQMMNLLRHEPAHRFEKFGNWKIVTWSIKTITDPKPGKRFEQPKIHSELT